MKRLGLLMVILCAMALASCSSSKSAVRAAADAVTAEQVAYMLDKRLYKIDFSRAFPMSGPSFPLSYSYFISVIGDRVESFLPYFGIAYSLPMDGGEGLRFTAPITGYTDTSGRNGKRVISFTARTPEDSYDFRLEVFPTGSSHLTVNSGKKQNISFSGQMDLEPDFEVIRIDQ